MTNATIRVKVREWVILLPDFESNIEALEIKLDHFTPYALLQLGADPGCTVCLITHRLSIPRDFQNS